MNKNYHYFINPEDSFARCPCSRCGRLPVIAKRSDGKFVAFCPACHWDRGLHDLPPDWYADDKDETIFLWSARQFLQDICLECSLEL